MLPQVRGTQPANDRGYDPDAEINNHVTLVIRYVLCRSYAAALVQACVRDNRIYLHAKHAQKCATFGDFSRGTTGRC